MRRFTGYGRTEVEITRESDLLHILFRGNDGHSFTDEVDVSDWDTAHARSITDFSGDDSGELTLTHQDGSTSTASHDHDTLSDLTVDGDLGVTGNVTIEGDLTVSGSRFETEVETVEVTDNLIHVNHGESGDGVSSGVAGIEVDRGTLTPYRFVFDESIDFFSVGKEGELQAVATREDSPTKGAFATWDDDDNRFVTSYQTEDDGGTIVESQNLGSAARRDADEDWDTAYERSPTELSGSGNGTLTLSREGNDAGDLTTDLSHSHDYGDLPISSSDVDDWNTAYDKHPDSLDVSSGSGELTVELTLHDGTTLSGSAEVSTSDDGSYVKKSGDSMSGDLDMKDHSIQMGNYTVTHDSDNNRLTFSDSDGVIAYIDSDGVHAKEFIEDV